MSTCIKHRGYQSEELLAYTHICICGRGDLPIPVCCHELYVSAHHATGLRRQLKGNHLMTLQDGSGTKHASYAYIGRICSLTRLRRASAASMTALLQAGTGSKKPSVVMTAMRRDRGAVVASGGASLSPPVRTRSLRQGTGGRDGSANLQRMVPEWRGHGNTIRGGVMSGEVHST